MRDAALERDGRDEPSAIGYVLVATLALAGVAKWMSDLTAGQGRGGRYDLALVNHLSSLAFLLFATVAFMALIGAGCRLAALVRSARPGSAAKSGSRNRSARSGAATPASRHRSARSGALGGDDPLGPARAAAPVRRVEAAQGPVQHRPA